MTVERIDTANIKEARAQVNNNGTVASIVTQIDTQFDVNDAISSVSRSSTGIVVVNFKSGFFTSTPVVLASAYGSANNNWIVSVNSVTTSSATIYTFNSGTTLTDFNFTISAMGVK